MVVTVEAAEKTAEAISVERQDLRRLTSEAAAWYAVDRFTLTMAKLLQRGNGPARFPGSGRNVRGDQSALSLSARLQNE